MQLTNNGIHAIFYQLSVLNSGTFLYDRLLFIISSLFIICFSVPKLSLSCMRISYDAGKSRGQSMTITSITIVCK